MLEQLGKRLKQIRQAYDYSGAYVADEIGFSSSTLWQVEKGQNKPSVEFIANISVFYGISLDLLVFGSDEDFQQRVDELLKKDFNAELAVAMERQGYGRANTRWHKSNV